MDAKGNWSADGLMEGFYEVIPDLPAGYVHSDSAGATVNVVGTTTSFYSQQMVELMGGRADDDTRTFFIKDRNAGAAFALTSVTIDGTSCTTAGTPDASANKCADNKRDDGSIVVKATASTGATITLSTSATDPKPSGGTSRSVPVANGENTTVSLPAAGSTTFYVHIAAGDGYLTNAGAVEGFIVRRDADVRVNTVTIGFQDGKIVLDREEMGLTETTDGETGPNQGVTTIRYTVDKADDGSTAVPTGLTITPVGKNTKFDAVTYEVLTDAPANSGTFPTCTAGNLTGTDGGLTLEANNDPDDAAGKGEAAICFQITDSDGAATPDTNADNMLKYRLILTRK